jgi:hypothetical protein
MNLEAVADNNTLPFWLSSQRRYVAKQLINNGFEFFLSPRLDHDGLDYSKEIIEGWEAGFIIHEYFVLSVDGCYFRKDLPCTQEGLNYLFLCTKRKIKKYSREWQTTNLNHVQLTLPIAG